MTSEFDVMPYDATLLAKVIEERGITVQALAARAGYDDKSVYRYLSGERTTPSTVFRAAFELTGDVRLVTLVSGSVPVCWHTIGHTHPAQANGPQNQQPREPERIPPIDQLFPQASTAIEQLAASLKYIHKIVADGRIDASDGKAIDSFNRHAAEAQRLIALTTAAVSAHQQRSVA